MNKNVQKFISKEEKFEFYKKYTDKEFQLKLEKSQDKYHKIGLLSIKISIAICLIVMLVFPWIVFACMLGFIIPIIAIHMSNQQQKKAIEQLTENIKYEDFIEMVETGEWQEIAKSLATPEQEQNKKTFVKHSQARDTIYHVQIEVDNTNNLEL